MRVGTFLRAMTDNSTLRILIVDDHALMRDALMTVLRRMFPLAWLKEVDTAAEAEVAVMDGCWDLAVLDLRLPDADEFETVRKLHALRPKVPILVYSMFCEEKMGKAALAAGASGYLCKAADRANIGVAVSEMLAGRGYVSERLRTVLAQRDAGEKGCTTALSARESEVLLALGRGLSNKEIASRLALGVSSVGTYRARIMAKLSLRTTAHLQRYVFEQRLVHD